MIWGLALMLVVVFFVAGFAFPPFWALAGLAVIAAAVLGVWELVGRGGAAGESTTPADAERRRRPRVE